MTNLRSTYGKHRRKQEGSAKSGAGARDVYNPKWKFFTKIDAFLRDHMKALASKSNLDIVSEDEQSANETDYDDEDDHEEVRVEAPLRLGNERQDHQRLNYLHRMTNYC